MELVDRVNKNDVIIGQTTKEEAHKNKYIHRVATIFCFNPEGRLLVQQRKKDDQLDNSVGGHVKTGESYQNAAGRELQEELGLAKELKMVGSFYGDEINERNPGKDHYFGLFEAILTAQDLKNIVVAPDEVEQMIPMKIEDIVDDMAKNPQKYTVGFMKNINYYISKKNLPVQLVEIK